MDSQSPEDQRKHTIVDPHGHEKNSNTSPKDAEKIVEYGGPNNRYGRLNVMLGKGAYKIVWKALDLEEGIEVAWNCSQASKTEITELAAEIEILKKVRHANVIMLYDSWFINGEFVFVTELMTSGTLREYTLKFKEPKSSIVKRWARQILRGLHYLHSQAPPIIHRDIKCDNIFVNGSHGEIKIGDMGTAKMKFGRKYTVIGTPEFMAPEMYEEKGYSEKVDIYAFGMCLLEIATGDYPYSECKNAAQIYKKVSQGIKPDCLGKVKDEDLLLIINHCLSPESERWTARKLLEHPIFAEDPEVTLLTVNDGKTLITMQLSYKGLDKHSIKFEFHTEKDTAEMVVKEMIDENVLASKYQGLVSGEIHRILREVQKTEQMGKEQGASPKIPSSPPKSRPSNDVTSLSKRKSTSPLESASSGEADVTMTREYPDDTLVEEFVSEVAILANRGIDKAADWIAKLHLQDIMMVGDLRALTDADWAELGLTVFCNRILKNALQGKIVTALSPSTLTSPKPTPIVVQASKLSAINEEEHHLSDFEIPQSIPNTTLQTTSQQQ